MDRRRRQHRAAELVWRGRPDALRSAACGQRRGLIVGRALCLAPVTLLDPRDWRWPDDGEEEWPLCWICLALTHVQS
jgi:hypothetical protein